MKRNLFKKSTLAAAVAIAALGLGAAGNAQAAAYSYSYVELNDFHIASTGVEFNAALTTRDTTTFAKYGVYPTAGHNDAVVPPAGSDALQAISGPGAFPDQNTWATWWYDGANYRNGQGARADAQTDPGSAITGTVNLRNVTESLVIGGAYPSTNADEKANNTYVGQFTAEEGATLTFTGELLWQVIALTDFADPGPAEYASADVGAVFSVKDSDGRTVFKLDPFSLIPVGDARYGMNSCVSNDAFPARPECDSGVMTVGLAEFGGNMWTATAAGTYNLDLTVRGAGEERSVPEPASMALLGLGLVGLAATRRRFVRV